MTQCKKDEQALILDLADRSRQQPSEVQAVLDALVATVKALAESQSFATWGRLRMKFAVAGVEAFDPAQLLRQLVERSKQTENEVRQILDALEAAVTAGSGAIRRAHYKEATFWIVERDLEKPPARRRNRRAKRAKPGMALARQGQRVWTSILALVRAWPVWLFAAIALGVCVAVWQVADWAKARQVSQLHDRIAQVQSQATAWQVEAERSRAEIITLRGLGETLQIENLNLKGQCQVWADLSHADGRALADMLARGINR